MNITSKRNTNSLKKFKTLSDKNGIIEFSYKHTPSKKLVGLHAQKIQEAFGDDCIEQISSDENENDKLLGINMIGLTTHMINAIIELNDKIDNINRGNSKNDEI
jgi:hypothetical protein